MKNNRGVGCAMGECWKWEVSWGDGAGILCGQWGWEPLCGDTHPRQRPAILLKNENFVNLKQQTLRHRDLPREHLFTLYRDTPGMHVFDSARQSA